MFIERYDKNPIVTPDMVKPSNPGYVVRGVFNPGAVMYKDEVILLLRVAESCMPKEGFVTVPVVRIVDGTGVADILQVSLDDPAVKLKDTRGIEYKGTDYLSTLSHIRLARSRDGFNFEVDDKPFLLPGTPEEIFGVEDARITCLDGTYFVNYTAVSPDGWVTALARTKDFETVERLGVIFCPENKDVSIFPEKIKGKYCALHRPNNSGFGKPSIWYAESTDLLHWGNHSCVLRPRDNCLEKMKIGGGPPCIRTEEGWLHIYHAKGENQLYSLFALLLDTEDPRKVIKRGKEPIMRPETEYERSGFFPNCVFSNGLVRKDDGTLLIYYGACDNYVCVARTTVQDILSSL